MSDSIPPSDGARLSLQLGRLTERLRMRDVRCGVEEQTRAQRALTAIDVMRRDRVRDALRATMCSCRQDLGAFDEAFEEVFGQRRLQVYPAVGAPQPEPIDAPSPARESATDDAPGQHRPTGRWSDLAALLDKDFADFSAAERAQAVEVMRRIARRRATRPSLRTRPHAGGGAELDLRATMRSGLRYGGDFLDLRWRTKVARPRPLVLICDVSGSMQPYARMLLLYLHVAVVAGRRVEAFVFSTHLRLVTRELALPDFDRAIDRTIKAVDDFASGTRIGASLAELNRVHGRRIGRGAVTVVLSDGWDRGEPDVLEAELERLRRCSYRLVWLNPLAAGPGFEPLTRGMAAAVAHADRLMAGNSLASLREVATLLEDL